MRIHLGLCLAVRAVAKLYISLYISGCREKKIQTAISTYAIFEEIFVMIAWAKKNLSL